MQKLLRGIIDFRRRLQSGYRETFARLALGQSPDALMIACADSRVVPNLFASSDPGDLFVLRNIGNLVPPMRSAEETGVHCSAAAAVEFSLLALQVKDIVVVGHSECGAMRAILQHQWPAGADHLGEWLQLGFPSLARLNGGERLNAELSPHNQLSQLNVLQQLEHLLSYPAVQERVASGTLRLNAWWFDIAQADVLAYDPDLHRFVVIDEAWVERQDVERRELERRDVERQELERRDVERGSVPGGPSQPEPENQPQPGIQPSVRDEVI